MELSPVCHAATAPKSTPYQSMLKRPSPSSFQTVVSAPVDPSLCPSANESLNVPERGLVLRVDLVPVGVAGSDPGFDAVFGEWLDQLVEACLVRIVPGHGDHVLGQSGDGVRIGVANVAPEEQAAIERRERVVNLLEEGDIDGPVALLRDRVVRAAQAKIEGFVGADVDEGRGKLPRDLRTNP